MYDAQIRRWIALDPKAVGDFKSKEDYGKYIAAQQKSLNTQLASIFDNLLEQMQGNINDKYNKSTSTPAEIRAVENNANGRASKKLAGKVQCLNGQKPVTYKGAILPSTN